MGYVQLYTGNGKGKTTAAFGLALRAVGAGKNVFVAQFVKGMHYSENSAVKDFLPSITIRQYGRKCFIKNMPAQEDIDYARYGLEEIGEILRSGKYDMVVLDEACIAIYYQLFSAESLIRILAVKSPETEVIITGRYAPPELIDYADLVTEMTEIRHYYLSGIVARRGIEF
jgi:cob(I)alamin adenosyltransferase